VLEGVDLFIGEADMAARADIRSRRTIQPLSIVVMEQKVAWCVAGKGGLHGCLTLQAKTLKEPFLEAAKK
jgi:hypothetical protein